jgi:ribosomal protein S18 acetylase RimI-like enzyme
VRYWNAQPAVEFVEELLNNPKQLVGDLRLALAFAGALAGLADDDLQYPGQRWVHPGVVTTIRQARSEDEPELRDIDAATWAAGVSPGPPPSAGAVFFGGQIAPADVLVAETGRVIAGFAALGQSGPLASQSHVLQIRGLAVHPARQRCGVGRRLTEACIEQARSRGARKLSLRVLGGNVAARRLYESCGFRVEGVLCEEFFLGGRYVDDVLMACMLDAVAGPGG